MSEDLTRLLDSVINLAGQVRELRDTEHFIGNDVIAPAYAAPEGTPHFDTNLRNLWVNYDGTAPGWQLIGGGGGPVVHNILSASHGDAAIQAVSRGSLIYGDNTPQWNELVHPAAANRILTTDANDVLWSTWALVGTAAQTYTLPTASGTLVKGSGAATQVTYWTDAQTIAGDTGFTYDAANDLVTITGSADAERLIIQGNAVQNDDLTIWRNSTPTNLLRVSNIGKLITFPSDTSVTLLGVGTRAATAAAGAGTTAMGYQAGGNTLGTQSVFIGYNAGYSAGNLTVAVGYACLDAATGTENTAVGWGALGGITTGVDNVALGIGAGTLLTTNSSRNIVIGATPAGGAGYNVSDTVRLGNYAGWGLTRQYTLYIEHTTSASTTLARPLIYGEFDNDIVRLFGNTALTNTVHNNLYLDHSTSNAPAAGFGEALVFALKSSTTASTDVGRLYYVWLDATHATRKAAGVLTAYDTAEYEYIRWGNFSGQKAVVVNETGGDFDFRVEGDSEQYAIFVEASSDYKLFSAQASAVTSPTMNLHSAEQFTLVGNIGDGYSAALTFEPIYRDNFTVTRHNYIEMQDPTLAASAAVTDAAIIRFDAAAGTHKAVDAGTTKTTPTAVDAWVKVNINGTIYYMPAYTSKTA